MSTSKQVVKVKLLGIWKAKQREVSSADEQQLVQPMTSTTQEEAVHSLPIAEMFQNVPAGYTGPSYVSGNIIQQVGKANQVGISTKAHGASKCLFKAAEWWLRVILKPFLGPT